MTLPANIRVNVLASFPTRVSGSGFSIVTKTNGIWVLGDDYRILVPATVIADPTAKIIAIQDLVTGSFSYMTVAAFIGSVLGTYRIVTAAGDATVGPTDTTLLLNKTAGATTNVLAPTSATRNGVPVTIKDYKGDANTNNITFVPNGAETIDGFSPAAAAANGTALIDINYGKKTFFPLTSGGWYT